MQILVIDDDPVCLALMREILSKHEYDSIGVADITQAIEVLRINPDIALIISDIVMPKGDGFCLLRYLKNKKKYRQIPILMCTSRHDPESVISCATLGARDYIIKPIRENPLIDKIRFLLSTCGRIILIADAGPVNATVLGRLLRNLKYHVVAAPSAERAISIISKRCINAIIAGPELTDMTTLEFLARVKEKQPGMPVMLIIDRDGNMSTREWFSQGGDGCIYMPFRGSEIESKLNSLCRESVPISPAK